MRTFTMTRLPPPSSRHTLPTETPDAAGRPLRAMHAAAGTLRALGLAWVLGASAVTATAQPARATAPVAAAPATTAKATFAGGCFWCVEADFDKVPGVLSTTSGYMGGTVPSPTYEQVAAKVTGHAEVVEIVFDPARVNYEQLLAVYWRSIDPTTKDRQFCDVGSPYRSAIFANDAAQLAAARRSLQELEKSKPFKEPIVTQIETAGRFWPAEGYHQDYYKKNPVRYGYYRASCGRDARLETLWGKP
jgi:peptide-methionine (S)-S-oxide reductase